MSATASSDDVVLAGYFDINLTGLESLKFTNISGLNHSVPIIAGAGMTEAGPADDRTVATPQPITLTMSHVVLTTMDLWTWVQSTITSRADTTAKKSGTLSIMPMGGAQTPLKTWNLDDVYLNSIHLDSMGAGASSYLTATISVLVGSCKPM